ncbi:MAG: DUF4199 domain-containing protein [Bacteroidaceae bacterium]|nr:DUF4199 domain-containing protein [Bacteroidaceae bacterium]
MSSQEQPSMIHYAMNFGAVVGVYYIAKFCLFPMSFNSTFAGMLFIGLTLMVPLLMYRLVKYYRDRYLGGDITFTHALAFTVLSMGFGSLLAAVAHYTYFAFIDGGAMMGAIEQSVEQMVAIAESTAMASDTTAVVPPVLTDSIAQVAPSIAGEDITLVTSLDSYITLLRTTTEQIKAMTPIDMTIGMLSNNLSWSIIVALPVAAFASLRNLKEKKS